MVISYTLPFIKNTNTYSQVHSILQCILPYNMAVSNTVTSFYVACDFKFTPSIRTEKCFVNISSVIDLYCTIFHCVIFVPITQHMYCVWCRFCSKEKEENEAAPF